MRSSAPRRRLPAVLAIVVTVTLGEALLVGKFDPQETSMGFGIALLTAAATVAALGAARLHYAPSVRWIVFVPRVAWNVLRDLAIVTIVLVRALGGKAPRDRVVELPFRPGGDDPASAARRALAVAGVSTSPNSIVLGVDEGRGTMRVHFLSADHAAPPLSPEWPL